MVFEAQVNDPSRIEPFRNHFSLVVRPEREDQERPQRPPKPKPDQPGHEHGKEAQQDTRLDVPSPVEVWERDWAEREPPFDKFTAMRVRRQPSATGEAVAFDYFINMSNVFIETAVKERPRRAFEVRNRYKFGMTFITLALIRQDFENGKKTPVKSEDDDEAKEPQDLAERIAEVTSAIAPFLLPLVDSLSRITKESATEQPLSEIAGETA